ncbi:MAG: lysophospholipid acyltransferase family protein [Candidatus Auribacterota bacterium]|nr:lysophospholipid acyltransferase family protein [Candidatus Auribacterota bacterium]
MHKLKKKFKHLRRTIQYGCLYYLLRILQKLANYMPESLVFFACELLALTCFYLFARERRKTINNLNKAFSSEKKPEEIFAIARGTFVNLGRNFAELLRWDSLTDDELKKRITCSNIEYAWDILKQNKGAVVLTCHSGNFELIPPYFAARGHCGAIIARAFHDSRINDLLVELRKSKGCKVIDRDDSPRSIFASLRENRLLGILADQDIRKLDGVFVDFFGHSAYTPIAPVIIAQTAGCPLLPMIITRDPLCKYRHHIKVYPPIELVGSKKDRNALVVNTQKWSKLVEDHIRAYPDQWVWMHNRWKTTPEKLKRD